jgi:hypothetical protein
VDPELRTPGRAALLRGTGMAVLLEGPRPFLSGEAGVHLNVPGGANREPLPLTFTCIAGQLIALLGSQQTGPCESSIKQTQEKRIYKLARRRTMLNSKVADGHPDDEVRHPVYSPDNKLVIQSLLATLANFDFDYERERNLVCSSTTDPNLRLSLLRRMAKRHDERREPYVRHLQLLQARHPDGSSSP